MNKQEVSTSAEIGSRVVVDGHRATVRYIGSVGHFAGEWLGVDWDDPTRGKHDGSHENKQYFVAASAHSGSFVRPHRVEFGYGILRALRERYAGEIDQVSFPEQQIGSKTIEFVRMDKTQHQQQDFSLLKVVVLDDMPVSRVLDNSDTDLNLPCCIELNLRSTLIFRWSDVFYLVSHMPKLHILNLRNIMQPLLQATHVNGAERVTTLILSECRLDWQQVEFIGQIFPSIAEAVLSFNRITTMTEPSSTSFQHLTKLDLEGNNIGDFNFVRCLSKLPKLKYLNANNIGIPRVRFTDGDVGFPSLETLLFARNMINDWASVHELARLPALTHLVLHKNPLAATETPQDYRQLVIAKISNLRQLDRTDCLANERRGAELDYLKRFGADWYATKAEDAAVDALDVFNQEHPSFERLIGIHGAPDKFDPRLQDDGRLKNRLIEICFESPNGQLVRRSVPRSMTVHKLRALASRLCRVNGRVARLSVESDKTRGFSVPLDNDFRDLDFFSIQSGDTIRISVD